MHNRIGTTGKGGKPPQLDICGNPVSHEAGRFWLDEAHYAVLPINYVPQGEMEQLESFWQAQAAPPKPKRKPAVTEESESDGA